MIFFWLNSYFMILLYRKFIIGLSLCCKHLTVRLRGINSAIVGLPCSGRKTCMGVHFPVVASNLTRIGRLRSGQLRLLSGNSGPQ